MYDGRYGGRVPRLGETLWAKSRQLSWRLRWSRVRLHYRYLQERRMVKSLPAWWVDLLVERCSVALWRRGPLRRRRFITRRRRSILRSLPAVSFASASGTAMAGKFAASRFAIDRRTFLRSRLEQNQIRPPLGGLFVWPQRKRLLSRRSRTLTPPIDHPMEADRWLRYGLMPSRTDECLIRTQ